MKNAKLTVAIYEGWHYRRRWQNQEKHESKQHQRFDGKNQIHWKVLEDSSFSAGQLHDVHFFFCPPFLNLQKEEKKLDNAAEQC